MTRGRPDGSGLRPLGLAAGLAALLLAAVTAVPAGADDRAVATADPSAGDHAEAARGVRFSLGLLAGTTQFDAGLADYQWNTRPRMAWGGQAMAGAGRFAAGLRLWTTRTTQAIGDLGDAPGVRATSIELVGEGRLAQRWGTELLATAGAGRLHLGYHPDQVAIQPPGPVGAIVVALAPVDAWIAGGGLAVRRALLPGWSVALGVEHRSFAIDTAHRVGNAIVLTRESFGDWSARFELARHLRRR